MTTATVHHLADVDPQDQRPSWSLAGPFDDTGWAMALGCRPILAHPADADAPLEADVDAAPPDRRPPETGQRRGSGVISATGTPRPTSPRMVAMRRPGCTASRGGPHRSGPSNSAAASRSTTLNTSPHNDAGSSIG